MQHARAREPFFFPKKEVKKKQHAHQSHSELLVSPPFSLFNFLIQFPPNRTRQRPLHPPISSSQTTLVLLLVEAKPSPTAASRALGSG